jgi:hypothetical protein
MRATITALAAVAVAAAVWLAADAAAPTVAEQHAADFVRSTCVAAIKDPAALERVAQDRGWTRLATGLASPAEPIALIGTWQASADGEVYVVSVATSRVHGRGQNLCSVAFKDSKLARAGFFAALTDGWTLAPRFDLTDADSRDEMYSVAGVWPNELLLQMLSARDGAVTSMTLLASL